MMSPFWPAATIALAIFGYFAWSSYSPPALSRADIEDCHRLDGQVQALHQKGETASADILASARACTVAFGRDWAASGGERAVRLRAEGAARVR